LKKNEEKIVNFVLNPRDDFKYYDVNKQDYDVEPGNFEIQIGSSSKDIRLKKTIKVID
jgi:beta-glucosidase